MTPRTGIICAGNWIVDVVHEIDQWPRESGLVRIRSQSVDIGGGAANVIAALTKLDTGLQLWPMGAVGQDDYGRLVLGRCDAMGLNTSAIKIDPTTQTAHTHVMSVPGQSRTFFYQGGANDKLCEGDFKGMLLGKCSARIFYLGYLMLLGALDCMDDNGETGATRVLAKARAAGMLTCVDLVSIAHPEFPVSVQSALPQIDCLILNEIEAAYATGHALSPEGDIPSEEALKGRARQLVERGVRQAVILHTPQNSLWVGADGSECSVRTVPLPSAAIVSPLGAGDAFCAGLLYAIHEGWTAHKCLALANATARASLCGTTASEAIPSLEELGRQVAWPEENRVPRPEV